jgi:alpha-1,2-mannosyltransferase
VVALALVGLASLLAAPIAVTHHWVYALFLVPLLVAPRYRSWWPVLLPATLVFLAGPNHLLRDAASRGWVEQLLLEVLGTSQCLAAIAVFVAAVIAARSRRPALARAEDSGVSEDVPAPQQEAQPHTVDTTR